MARPVARQFADDEPYAESRRVRGATASLVGREGPQRAEKRVGAAQQFVLPTHPIAMGRSRVRRALWSGSQNLWRLYGRRKESGRT